LWLIWLFRCGFRCADTKCCQLPSLLETLCKLSAAFSPNDVIVVFVITVRCWSLRPFRTVFIIFHCWKQRYFRTGVFTFTCPGPSLFRKGFHRLFCFLKRESSQENFLHFSVLGNRYFFSGQFPLFLAVWNHCL